MWSKETLVHLACVFILPWLLSEKYVTIIADFFPVYTLKNAYTYIWAVVNLSAVVGFVSSSRDVGDQSERIPRAAASLVKDPEIAVGKERVRELQL